MSSIAFLLPGLGGSGPNHWQQIWAREYDNYRVVNQIDWNQPLLDDWLDSLAAVIDGVTSPYMLIAHSLGCALAARWPEYSTTVSLPKPSLIVMVAPADVDSSQRTPKEARDFSPMPIEKLECDSIVVASSNDPYVSIYRARELAWNWGSKFVDVGPIGHINEESALGNWPEGKKIIQNCVRGRT